MAMQFEGAFCKIRSVDVIVDNLCRESLGVAPHPLHECGPLQAFHIPRPVIDVRRRHQLAALFDAGDQ